MNIFSAVFLKELKRFICLRNLIFILIVFLLCFYFVNKGIQDHKGTIDTGKGAAIVFLTTEPIVSDSSCEDESDYEDLPEWASQVDKIKSILRPGR